MNLKQLIDQIMRASSSALQRSEVLQLVDQMQARMYSANCSELLERTTITAATVTTYPTAREITWGADPRKGDVAAATSYLPGDLVRGVNGGANKVEWWLVESPYTTADPLTDADINEFYELHCTAMPARWVESYDPSTVPHEGVTATDGVVVTAGQFVWFADIEQWWLCWNGYTVAAATLQADRWANCYPTATPPIVDGETTQETAMPDYIEVSGYRAVTAVGTLDELTQEFKTVENVRIVQARTRDEATKIYTAGLTQGGTYTVEGYVWPDTITSESDDLMVPDSDRDGILKTLVMREIERENFGNSVYWEQLYQQEWPKWLDRINRDKSRPRRTPATTYNRLAG